MFREKAQWINGKIFSIITNNVTIPYLEVKNIEDALISLIYQDYTQYKK